MCHCGLFSHSGRRSRQLNIDLCNIKAGVCGQTLGGTDLCERNVDSIMISPLRLQMMLQVLRALSSLLLYNAPSNNNLRGLLIAGGGDINAGLKESPKHEKPDYLQE